MADMEPLHALVLLAEGSEEMEVVIVVDVLRRAGLTVTLAGLEGRAATRCSRGVWLVPDMDLSSFHGKADVVVLPGGLRGAEAMAASAAVGALLSAQASRDGFVAALCAAPIVLLAHGLFRGRAMTSHPSVRAQIEGYADYRETAVVVDDNLVTSRGPGTSFEFALRIIALLMGREVADSVRGPLMLPG